MECSVNTQEYYETSSVSQVHTKRAYKAEIGKRIKDTEIRFIVEEKRPGGLLSET